MKDQDSIFFRNFSWLLAVMVLITIILAIYGSHVHDELLTTKDNDSDRSSVAASISPVAKVNTSGEAMTTSATKEMAAAFDGSLDGEMIYNNVCAACHTAGIAGSPKLEVAAWAGRSEKGLEALTQRAIDGFQGDAGYMPAKGGRNDLSAEQVQATVAFMLDSLK